MADDMHRWEQVNSSELGTTYRMLVPGGWIYHTVAAFAGATPPVQTYVPDPVSPKYLK